MKLGRLNHIGVATPFPFRHPELVSGSISRIARTVQVEAWMLKQVQHDGFVGVGA